MYEVFDFMLEIDLEYEFVFLNCGIVFYYGGCFDLVVKDLVMFVEKVFNDFFWVFWVYFVDK